MPKKASLEERFWEKVDVRAPDQCWMWQGATRLSGYGVLSTPGDNRRQFYAHRYSLHIAGVDVPADCYVCHTCDVPGCVNPSHLYVGDGKTNAKDMSRRGRWRNQHAEGPNAAPVPGACR